VWWSGKDLEGPVKTGVTLLQQVFATSPCRCGITRWSDTRRKKGKRGVLKGVPGGIVRGRRMFLGACYRGRIVRESLQMSLGRRRDWGVIVRGNLFLGIGQREKDGSLPSLGVSEPSRRPTIGST